MCQEHAHLKGIVEEQNTTLRRLADEAEAAAAERRKLIDENLRLCTAVKGAELVTQGLRQLGFSGGAGAVVDTEAIVRQVLARVPAGGAVVQVTPPEKLRADFQRDEVARIVSRVAALDPLPKSILKLLAALEGRSLFQKLIAERLGRTYSGGAQAKTMREAVEALGDFVASDTHGVRASIREKIAGDLATYQATDVDVEVTYQRVLSAMATNETG